MSNVFNDNITMNTMALRQRQSMRQVSFKDSFAESENFGNIEEKLDEDTVISCRNVVCSSLNQLIKERFLGPIMAAHGGNSNSFMRRNILMTGSNCTNKSSMSTVKGSFVMNGFPLRPPSKQSFQFITCDDVDE
jgi:hypothetical protein